jgi:hypothetical protein
MFATGSMNFSSPPEARRISRSSTRGWKGQQPLESRFLTEQAQLPLFYC